MQIRTSKGQCSCHLSRIEIETRISGQISKSNAFITPQWGAVVIHNSIANQPINLSRSFQIFNLQLTKLLNIPAIPSNVLPTASVLEPWQLDLLIRNRLSQAAKETIGNLAAIVKLSDDIPNMRVGREVLQDINSAIKELNIVSLTIHYLDRKTKL